ncbi:hypothetical protein [Streptomyces sp. SM11]|uniref:hypothetical protein n=1 Tax=Streptomyces sp. SM11 TaxID=565557 RepID=UPI000CD57400|nr:hypothetical protein [Streptomyces sp. SM11]
MASTTAPTGSGAAPAPRPKRRTFTAEYKLRVVAGYDATPSGEEGAVPRRERLYHPHVIEWRQAREADGLGALTDHVRLATGHTHGCGTGLTTDE